MAGINLTPDPLNRIYKILLLSFSRSLTQLSPCMAKRKFCNPISRLVNLKAVVFSKTAEAIMLLPQATSPSLFHPTPLYWIDILIET